MYKKIIIMERWFSIDLEEETRFESGLQRRGSKELIITYIAVSIILGIGLHLLCTFVLWPPLVLLVMCLMMFVSIRNIFIYLIPRRFRKNK